MESQVTWAEVEQVFNGAKSFAMGTVDEDGAPRVSPIGSVFLTGQGKGFYFERYPKLMRANLDRDPRVCILAVHMSLLFVLGAFIKGRFKRQPALRLMCDTGQRREATAEEQRAWLDRVRAFRFFKGYDLLWKDMNHVRDFTVKRVESVELGRMSP